MRNKLKITVIIPFLGGKSLSLQSYSFYGGQAAIASIPAILAIKAIAAINLDLNRTTV